jgi:hypothetical protein
MMDEGPRSKAIPLRRSRTRALTVRSRQWSDGVRRLLEPPRQLWLVALGGPALIIRGVGAAWTLLAQEGAAAEATLLSAVRRRATGQPAARETVG